MAARWIRFRPFNGRSATRLFSITWPTAEFSVSRTAPAAATSTVSVTAPTSSTTSTRAFCCVSTLSPVTACERKPCISARRVYSPISIRGNVYSPAWLVILSRRCPVATRVIVILAPATTEPEESVTTPRISVAVVWALPSNTIAARHNAEAKVIKGCCFFIMSLLAVLTMDRETLYDLLWQKSKSRVRFPRKNLKMDRRTFSAALAGGAFTGGIWGLPTPQKLVPWMYMIYPLEQWLENFRQTFDAWASGGVRGIVIGPLRFWDGPPTFDFTYARAGAKLGAFAPDPQVYKSYGLNPPVAAPRDPQKEKKLTALLDDAASRGWEIMLFGPGYTGVRKSFEQDPFGALSLAAGVRDTMRAFPQAHGVIVDGAGEQHYELDFHHGGELFEIRDQQKPVFKSVGMDVDRMARGIARLR